MLDRWFIEDIKKALTLHNRMVLIDPNGKADFLKDILNGQQIGSIFTVGNRLDEIRVKYDIEKNYQNKKTIIFATLPLEKLSFIREYCETGTYLDLTLLHRYIKQKIYGHLGVELPIANEEVIAIGKISIGKGDEFWSRIKASGKNGVFSPTDILDFLSDPDRVFNKYDEEEKKLFCDFMSIYTPHALWDKPPSTIAKEIVAALFDVIVKKQSRDNFLFRLYHHWINSRKHALKLKEYLKELKLPQSTDIWQLPVDHPFKEADDQALRQIVAHIEDKDWIADKLDFIRARAEQEVLNVIGVDYWCPIITLLSYEIGPVDMIHTLDNAIEHYVNQFYRLDNDMRLLYQFFLSEEKILSPLQYRYLKILELFLEKWFQLFVEEYQENQSGLLARIIEENTPPVAIIVGDAISFGIAQEIRHSLKSEFKIDNKFVCAGFPSETLNNMSKLFGTDGVLLNKTKREKILSETLNKDLNFIQLDDLSITYNPNDYTILYSDDVDSISEKKEQKALKYYREFMDHISEKIRLLFKCGYKKVFLVSDHGFVLTGRLDEADKIEIPLTQDIKVTERYCLSKKKIFPVPEYLIEFEQPYGEYNFMYFAKSPHPFKSPGTYGFSHGGLTPQELIVPFFKFEKEFSDYSTLPVNIVNSDELKSVVGNNFKVTIKSGPHSGDFFGKSRKIQIAFIKDKACFYRSDIITIHAEKQIDREFAFEKYDSFKIEVMDAYSKEILDSCPVEKVIARDLGGLGGES